MNIYNILKNIVPNQKIMICGLGDVGGHYLEILSRLPLNNAQIICTNRNIDWGIRKTNNALIGNNLMNNYPNIKYIKMDLDDKYNIKNVLNSERPDIIFFSVATSSPQIANYKTTVFKGGIGTWTFWVLSKMRNLMECIKQENLNTKVVNASTPDIVNYVLSKLNLSPNIGCGNLYHSVAKFEKALSEKYNIPIEDISINHIAAHAVGNNLSKHGNSGNLQYYLEAYNNDKNLLESISKEELFKLSSTHKIPPGKLHNHFAASSGVLATLSLMSKEFITYHAPGPNGLPGGYKVKVNKDKIEIDLPKGITKNDAININLDGLKGDGIETISDDGTIYFTKETTTTIKELLNIDLDKVSPDQWEYYDKLLYEKYLELSKNLDLVLNL